MNKFKKITIGCVMASMLVVASIATAATQSFKDVDSSFWATSAIQWGVQQKITSGYDDGTFKPNKTVTEEEFMTLLVRAFGGATPKEKEQRWSDPYYRVAADKNLPVSDDRTATITRQSVANIIVGTQGVNFTGDDAVQYMLMKGLTKGKTAPTIEGYQGQDTLTRAEAIAFIKNAMDKVENKTMLARPKETSSRSSLEASNQKESEKENNGPTPTSTSKPILKIDNFVSSFNKSMTNLGISNDYELDAEKLEIRTTPDFIQYLYQKMDPKLLPNAYIFFATSTTDTGQITNLSFTIYGGIAKSIAADAIATYVQDAELGKELYEKSSIINAIDNADRTESQEPIIFSSNGYTIRYMYDKKVRTHAVSIGISNKN